MASGAPLTLQAVIGFGGTVPNGLIYHPDGTHVIYPLGSTVVIRNTKRNTQAFLQGHTDKVTALTLSKDGKRLASGQQTDMGFKAPVIVWDVDAGIRNANSSTTEGELVHKLVLHKVLVQDLDFSPCGKFLATLGGPDDNALVVWNVETGAAVCGSPAASHSCLTVRWFNNTSDSLLTAGHYNLKTWAFDLSGRKLHPNDCHLGTLRRVIQCVSIDASDKYAYCGTKTGDLLEVNVQNGRFSRASRNRFSMGISCVRALRSSVLVGNGDGSVARLDLERLAVRKSCQLMGGVTSTDVSLDEAKVWAGTSAGNTYCVDLESMEPELRSTAHPSPVNDVCFPAGCSDLFITAGGCDIRVWNVKTRMELLRIKVPNLECKCVSIMPNGRSIVSGWDDGKIRAFLPESGKLHYVITDAHAEAVTAVACTHDNSRIVSGGKDGRVRVWSVDGPTQTMEMSFKEHKRAVNSLQLSADGTECVSASADGSCIVWNLRRGVRSNALFASTVFQAVLYHPDESQLLTAGSDRKITYWDSADCNAIRIIDGSTEEIRTLDIEPDGILFVSGGNDKLVKVWNYDEGVPVATGSGHSGTISIVRISPDQRRIVSVGHEGAVFMWEMPAAGAKDMAASGYVARARVEDEIDDEAYGLADLREKRLAEMEEKY